MTIEEKCLQFYTNADYAQELGYPANPSLLQALGLYPFFIPITRNEGPEVIINNRRLIMLGSNNYLGLTTHPKVKQAAINAIKRYGTGCTGSRLLNGTLEMHLQLEEKLARFVGKEKALVFATGYQTNLGTLSSILGKRDVVISDKEAHASIIDGIFLSKFKKQIQARFFKHNDIADLEKILQSYALDQNKLVVVDGVFSMRGDTAPLPDLVRLCKKYNAYLMVDDAHSLGVLGDGRGTGFHFDCIKDIDLIMGTFSKSFASLGGFIAGRKQVIHWIQHFARPFIFSASLAPANIATVLGAIDIIEHQPDLVKRINSIAARMRKEFRAMGYDIGNSQSAIISITIGDQFRTVQAWKELLKLGIYTNVALPPAVPADSALLRTSYMATHSDEQLQQVIEIFQQLKKKLQSYRFKNKKSRQHA
jgi:8-amino-7-oxononanoate synthase